MIDLNKIDFEEISVNDQYIDDMMEHFGFTTVAQYRESDNQNED